MIQNFGELRARSRSGTCGCLEPASTPRLGKATKQHAIERKGVASK